MLKAPSDSELHAGDIVESIDGIPTGGRSIQDIAEQIQSTSSDPSPSLSLSVRREEGGGELGTQSALQAPTGGRENGGGYNGGARKTERTLVVTLPRKSIKETGSVSASVSDVGGRRVGVIRVKTFDGWAERGVRRAVQEIKHADVWVLDLRGNLGGSVRAAEGIAGVFLGDSKPLVRVARGDGSEATLSSLSLLTTRADASAMVPEQEKMIVVVDAKSASASEIVASAIVEGGRGTTVGVKTRGKGVVQSAFGLTDGSAIVVTTGRLQGHLSGASWHKRGIDPNLSLPWLFAWPSALPPPLSLLPLDRDLSPPARDPLNPAERGQEAIGAGDSSRGLFRCPAFWACSWAPDS